MIYVGGTGHQGSCNNCVTIGANLGAKISGDVSGGGGAKFEIFGEEDGKYKPIEDIELVVEASGNVTGTLGLQGKTYFGSKCDKEDSLKFCGGPVSVSIEAAVKLPLFGGTYNITFSAKEWEIFGSFGGCSGE